MKIVTEFYEDDAISNNVVTSEIRLKTTEIEQIEKCAKIATLMHKSSLPNNSWRKNRRSSSRTHTKMFSLLYFRCNIKLVDKNCDTT